MNQYSSRLRNHIIDQIQTNDKHQLIKSQQIIQQLALQQWPYTDVNMDYNNEHHNVIFQRIPTIHSLELFGSLLSIQKSSLYQNNKIVNAIYILNNQFNIIHRIFEFKVITPIGLCGIWLCVQGIWQLITIDDNIPCTLKGNTIVSGAILSQYQWPIFIEKAIVKLLGAKYSILNQQVEDSIESIIFYLTGMPVQKYEQNDISLLSNYVKQKLHEGLIVYVETVISSDTICFVVESVIKSHNNTDLVILSAPNNTHLNTQLTWEQFRNKFKSVYVVKCHPDYQYSWIAMQPIYQQSYPKFIELGFVYEFILDIDSHIYITICQKDQNLYAPNLKQLKEYGLIRILLCQKIGDDKQFISGDFNCKQNLVLELQLQAGIYQVVCQAYFLQQNTMPLSQELVMQFYGSSVPTQIQQQNVKFIDALKQSAISLALSECSVENTRTYESQEQPHIQVTTQMDLGLLIFYYRNFGTLILEEEVQFDQYSHILDDTLKDKNVFNVRLHPNNDHLQLFLYDPIEAFKTTPTFSYKCSIKASLQQLSEQIEASNKHNTNQISSVLNQNNRIINGTQQPQVYTDADLLQFMKEHGKQAKRVWDDKPIEVYFYIYQHQQGVVLLYVNYTPNKYEEQISFIMHNLVLNCPPELMKEDGIYFVLDGYAHLFIYLDIQVGQQSYDFKMESQYKYST